MKRMISTLAVVTLWSLPVAAQSPKAGPSAPAPPEAKAVVYYPLKVGTKWEYEIDPGNGQKLRITGLIGGVEKVKDKDLARLDFYLNGQKLPATEHLQSDESGVFRARMNGVEVSPPLCLIKYPPKPGQSWESEMTTGRGPSARVVGKEGVPEEVKVPAGTYQAIPCTIVVTAGQETYTNVFWFARDVGIVKQRTETGSETVVMELSKFEPAK